MSYLTAQDILSADDIGVEDVEVPEWGGTVRVQGLNGQERDGFEAAMTEKRGKSYEANLSNIRAKLVARTVVDADGNRLFGDDQVSKLGKKSGAALERVFSVARRLSGMTSEDVEELAGNSDADQND